jgi:hypothetical protein
MRRKGASSTQLMEIVASAISWKDPRHPQTEHQISTGHVGFLNNSGGTINWYLTHPGRNLSITIDANNSKVPQAFALQRPLLPAV